MKSISVQEEDQFHPVVEDVRTVRTQKEFTSFKSQRIKDYSITRTMRQLKAQSPEKTPIITKKRRGRPPKNLKFLLESQK